MIIADQHQTNGISGPTYDIQNTIGNQAVRSEFWVVL
jgi:hypothetical protein